MNMYELSQNYQSIQRMIEDGQEGLQDTLESLDDAIEEKAVGYAKVMKNLEAQTKALKDEEKRLADRRKAIENNIKRMKESLQDAMLLNDKRRIKTDLFNFNIQNNPPSVSVVDEQLIPKQYYVEVAPKLDKKSIMERLKNGESVPGAEITQGEGLRIK